MPWRSLRWRLLLGAGVAILAAVTIAYLFMTVLFERHLERQLAAQLERDAERIVAGLGAGPSGNLVLTSGPSDPRLERPGSGFYWQVGDGDGALHSRSLWDQSLMSASPPTASGWITRRAVGPFEDSVLILERSITLDAQGDPIAVRVAESVDAIVTAQSEFGRELVVFLAGLWGVLMIAAWVQVQVGLAPLASLRRQVESLRGHASSRMTDAPISELAPVTQALNDLAAAREADLDAARARATDLAHGLKTPLAAIMAQSRRATASGAPEIASALDNATAAMEAVIASELARSRLAAFHAPAEAAPVAEVAEAIVRVLEHTGRGDRILFSVEADPDVTAPLGRDDLTALLGPVMENAFRFARRQALLQASATPDEIEISIHDDGPGLSPEQAKAASRRGARFDETTNGNGIGLSIARGLVEASGGRFELSRSIMGGLQVRMVWRLRQR